MKDEQALLNQSSINSVRKIIEEAAQISIWDWLNATQTKTVENELNVSLDYFSSLK